MRFIGCGTRTILPLSSGPQPHIHQSAASKMAAQKVAKPSKRSRKARKVRTEVSSDSSSSSDSDASSPRPQQPQQQDQQHHTSESPGPPSATTSESSSAAPEESPDKQTRPPPAQQGFEQFYLSQATKEFGSDLDKLRNAGDFRGGQSVELLVRALKQGSACFGAEERERVGGGG